MEYSWDDGAGVFHPLLNDGTRLCADDVDDSGYGPPAKLATTPANGLLLLSYARAARILGDPGMRRMALRLAEVMGWGQLENGSLDIATATTRLTGGPEDACSLQGLLELHLGDPTSGLLDAATALGDAMVHRHAVDGVLASMGDGGDAFPTAGTTAAGAHRITGIDSALPVALLHVAAQVGSTQVDLPQFAPNLSYFDPKILARQRGLR
jgi:hypothetical protein